MELRTEFFLAWRYLRPKRNAVSVITCISLLGVTLGVAVLMVVLAVMTGFTDLMKEKLLETTSHIQVYDYRLGYIEKPSEVVKAVKTCGYEAMPIAYSQVLVQKDDKFLPKAAIGIEPGTESGNLKLKEKILEGKYSLNKGEIMISDIISRELHANVGDKLLVHAPDRLARMIHKKKDGGYEMSKDADVYLPNEFRITGIYSFGKYDFDRNIFFLNLDDADELFGIPWGAASVVYIWTNDPFNLKGAVKHLSGKLPQYQLRTWQEMNQQLLGVLSVEKNMMFFLLVFIVLVAAFSITNTLITVVVQKTREIGLLKSLGASSGTVMRIFLIQGFFVGFIGTLCGTILGFSVIYWRNDIMHAYSKLTGTALFPKEFYYFNQLPAHITSFDVSVISITAVILCTVGGLIPAWRAAKLDPARALRYE
ncbi:MAG: hypothetical protein A2X49_06430 [Lentisphaerae bacterium GWF2_52_8]|nr:MAG: hypothetical protein A2X49_06430 [Lentisphaerae bacterium GWF2_52_8]